MKTIRFAIFLFLLSNSLIQAQQVFVKTFGFGNTNEAFGVLQTADDGYSITGTTTGSWNESPDMYLMHTDSLGIFQWAKLYGGNNIEQGKAFVNTDDSGYLLAGYSNSFNPENDYNGYIVKTDSLGNIQWSKIIGGADWDLIESVCKTSDRGFLLTGTTYSAASGRPGGWVVRVDSSGTILWQNSFDNGNDLFLKNVLPLSDGNFAVCGYFIDQTISKDQGFAAKIDAASGDTLWTYSYHGINATHFNALEEFSTGDLAIAGYIEEDTSGNKDEYFYGLTAMGSFNWESRFTHTGATEGYNDLILLNDTLLGAGSTSTFGSGNQDFRLMRANTLGQYIEANNWGGNSDEICYHIESTRDTGYILVGSTTSYGPSRQSIFLVKTDRTFTSTSLVTINVPEFSADITTIVYPNPFTSSIKIELDLPGNSMQQTEVRLFSATGALVKSIQTRERFCEFTTGELVSGIYLLQVIYPDGRSVLSKLMHE